MPVTRGISPKLIAGVLMAVLGYLATQVIVDFPPLVDLLIQVGLVGGGVYAASPGDVVPAGIGPASDDELDARVERTLRSERGDISVLEAAVLLLILVVILVLVGVLPR